METNNLIQGKAGSSEKEVIEIARQFRIKEIDRLMDEVNELDKRYDEIEEAEMAAGN